MVDYLKEYTEQIFSNEEFETKRIIYKPLPLSKEALLYRTIFEKHYPMHGHLIKDYSIPNKEWKGCNVDNTSARVLSNYETVENRILKTIKNN